MFRLGALIVMVVLLSQCGRQRPTLPVVASGKGPLLSAPDKPLSGGKGGSLASAKTDSARSAVCDLVDEGLHHKGERRAMKKTTVEIDIKEGNPILLELNDRGIKPFIVVDDEVYVHLSILLCYPQAFKQPQRKWVTRMTRMTILRPQRSRITNAIRRCHQAGSVEALVCWPSRVRSCQSQNRFRTVGCFRSSGWRCYLNAWVSVMHHSARISRNRSAASRRDILRRDRSNRTSAHANAATLSLISTADSIRPAAACLTST